MGIVNKGDSVVVSSVTVLGYSVCSVVEDNMLP